MPQRLSGIVTVLFVCVFAVGANRPSPTVSCSDPVAKISPVTYVAVVRPYYPNNATDGATKRRYLAASPWLPVFQPGPLTCSAKNPAGCSVCVLPMAVDRAKQKQQIGCVHFPRRCIAMSCM